MYTPYIQSQAASIVPINAHHHLPKAHDDETLRMSSPQLRVLRSFATAPKRGCASNGGDVLMQITEYISDEDLVGDSRGVKSRCPGIGSHWCRVSGRRSNGLKLCDLMSHWG